MSLRGGSALVLGAVLAAQAWAGDPYATDLVRALREWGGRAGVPVFVVQDLGELHGRAVPRVWRDLGIAELQLAGATTNATEDEARGEDGAETSASPRRIPDRAEVEESCEGPPAWTPPPRPAGWQPEPRAWVRELQRALAARGHYADAIDGLFGPATRAAIYEFQCSTGRADAGLTREVASALGVTLPR